ncbi:MAG: ImmA/IrrE family metallo-endopeptidase [Candidatus Magasanikbacteria bacterium]|nr:ImmA/IrrE family metallo-endopeptidase [Candidatus Magasanikbacteria bacterium]
MRNVTFVLFAIFIFGCSSANLYYEVDIPKEQFYNYEGTKLIIVDSHNTNAGCSFNWEASVPFLFLNPDYLKRFPKEFQWFVFFHEVGHHALGHTNYVPDDFISEDVYQEQMVYFEIEASKFSLFILHKKFDYLDNEFDIIFYYMPKELDSVLVVLMQEFRDAGFKQL